MKNAEKRAEIAYVHNHDSSDFVNGEKFERFILKKVKVVGGRTILVGFVVKSGMKLSIR